ncbi:MAG: family 10 glycosylhydrolase [Muribaculaceae bacterium]|nr:family 10 glycosylhydrolase [Muribaculaceae bacterium]
MKRFIIVAIAALSLSINAVSQPPKHEFRGAWLHIIGQGQYARQSTAENQEYLIGQLDALQRAGCNAIIWQVRPQADAAYPSELEPWSRWLTGTAGEAPDPMWDPLQFMIDQCHKRGMELHAWINPYRVTSGKDDKPAQGHVYYSHPEWFVQYADGKIYFDPALPESRDFINLVVADIVIRYDVDAIHMDDYFYPYPVQGHEFPDSASFATYGKGWGNIGDWRRNNVDMLIQQLHHTIKGIKPWVQLGISPFGIWRNKSSDANGSDTNGLQCYDALYADCPRWTALGWVDYMVPQLYWELEHKLASDLTLSYWWNDRANGRHMYYGQSVNNVMTHRDIADDGGDTLNTTQLDHKMRIMRKLPNVHGVTWWPGYSVSGNFHGVLDSLTTTHCSAPALIPAYTWLDTVSPDGVTNVQTKKTGKDTIEISWSAPVAADPMQQAVRFAVYRFPKGNDINIDDAGSLIAITGETHLTITEPKGRWTYAVTAIDRCWNESHPTTP